MENIVTGFFRDASCGSLSVRHAGTFFQQKKTSQIFLQSKLRLNKQQ